MIYFRNLDDETEEKIISVTAVYLFFDKDDNTWTVKVYFSDEDDFSMGFKLFANARELMNDIYSCIKRGYGVIDFDDYIEKE